MKYILKQQQPELFSTWKSIANDEWQPTFKELSGDTNKALKQALMQEQGEICCYCERRITLDDSHMEHIKPQSTYPELALEYENIGLSCQNQISKGEPRYCGNLKGNWFDDQLFISPYEQDCESFFSFTFDGRITPAKSHDLSAEETIKRLGLDIPKLIALRKAVIESFIDSDLSEEELQSFVSKYLERNNKNQFQQFWTTIHFLYR